MIHFLKAHRYLHRLQAPFLSDEALLLERTLGYARIALSLLAILAVMVDGTEPPIYTHVVRLMILGWCLYSLLTLILLRRAQDCRPSIVVLLQAGDFFWPSLLTCYTLGPSSPLFIAFTFVVMSAAFRWGYRETLLTVGLSMIVIVAQSSAMHPTSDPFSELQNFEYEINRLIIRLAFLVVSGVLIGRLGENVKERRGEGFYITRLLRSLRTERSMKDNIGKILEGYRQLYVAREILFSVEEMGAQRCYLWRNHSTLGPGAATSVIEGDAQSCYLLRDYPRTFRLASPQARIQTLRRDEKAGCSPLPSAQNILSTSYQLGGEWMMRLCVLDAAYGASPQEMLMAERMLEQLSAALYNIYLVRRIRRRSGVLERARVARELHDGAIQSLISIEMRLDVQRRHLAPEQAVELRSTQTLLHQEVLNLRDMMQQLRPVRVVADQLLDCMADQVDRFRRDSGVQARFMGEDIDDLLAFSPHLCRQLIRILQEALVNIRKHAAASMVLVSFERQEGAWRLSVVDDGRGADFEGEAQSGGSTFDTRLPVVIRERCEAIGAHLAVQSKQDRGYKVTITLPRGME